MNCWVHFVPVRSSVVWPALVTKSSSLEVINFPELDRTARHRLWLNHFGQFGPAGHLLNNERKIVSSSFSDQKKKAYSALLRDVEKLSWYQLDGEPRVCYCMILRRIADNAFRKDDWEYREVRASTGWLKVSHLVYVDGHTLIGAIVQRGTSIRPPCQVGHEGPTTG